MIDRSLTVGIGDMKLTRQQGILITYALGSCIGIAFYDPMIKLGALLHIMLPESRNMQDPNPLKYADLGIRETLRKIEAFGGRKNRLQCKIAGGARMFNITSTEGFGNIGERNIQSVKAIMRAEGIKILAEDVGQTWARTMSMDVTTGKVKIKSFGKADVMM